MTVEEERDWPFWERLARIERAGGLIDPGYLDEFHRMACGYARKSFREAINAHKDDYYADQFKGLSLFFIDNDVLNAVALENGNRRGIGLHLGTVRRLWWLFYWAMGSGRVINHWFESAPLSEQISLDAAMADPVWQDHEAARLPADRAILMYEIFLRSLEFMVYHELAHHARGHLPLAARELGLEAIEEGLCVGVEETADNALLRLIEFDADVEALDMMLVALDRDIPLETWESKEAGTECFLRVMAIVGVFLLLDLDHAPISEQYRQSHPAAVHRALRLTSALARGFGDHVGWNEKERIQEHDSSWYEASAMAALLGLPEGRWYGKHTDLIDLERYKEEDRAFVAFSQKLTEENVAQMTPAERERAEAESAFYRSGRSKARPVEKS